MNELLAVSWEMPPLSGPRERPRAMEGIFIGLLGALNAVGLLKRYRPITGEQVAQAMRKVVGLAGKPSQIHEPEDLFQLVAEKQLP